MFGCFCILALTWLSVLGGLHWINLKIHDHALNLPFPIMAASSTVLINNDLTLGAEFDAQLKRLLESLIKHKAQHIVLLTRIPQVATILVKSLPNMPSSVYLATPQQLSEQLSEQGSNSLQQLDLFSFTTIEGITRQFGASRAKQSIYSLYDDVESFSENKRYLNYFLDIATLPNLTLSQAVNAGIVDELVAAKVVFIDVDYRQNIDGFYMPGSHSLVSLSLGQVQALAAETLLSNSDVRPAPTVMSIAILLLTYTAYFFLLQLLTPRGVLLFGLTFSVLTYLACVLVLFQWHILLPVFEWIVVQGFSVFYLLSIERLREESLVLKMSAALNARLSKKVQPPSFYRSNDPWDNLHQMINQQLNLQRSIFLTKVPKDHRVVAIHALNCAIDDIKEMRRDFQRAPYSVALSTLKPYKLEKQYFTFLSQDEVEYLCPLIFNGRVLGFWALTIIVDEHWHQSTFENNLIQFSREITELLHHRHNYVREEIKQKHLLRRIFSLKLGEAEYQELDSSVSMLEKRFDSLQGIFDGMSTASTLYSLFGQIVHSNRQMEAMVKHWKLPFYSLSAHDFLLKLTNLDSAQIKQRLLQVTLDHHEVCLNVVYQQQPTHYILRIRPIKISNDNKQEGMPFLLLGLLFEFIDISEAQQLLSMKKDLYTQYFHQMRNNLGELYLVGRQLRLQLPDDDALMSMFNETLNECTKASVNIEQQLALQRSLTSTIVPINPYSEWVKIINQKQVALNKKRIQLAEDVPTMMSLVLAEPTQLASMLVMICDLLIDDSDSNQSTLSLTVKDTYLPAEQGKQRVITMCFSNQGYGVPESHLANLAKMSATQLSGSEQLLEKLLMATENARPWGLVLSLKSNLGCGYVIELSVPVFLMQ